MSKLKGVLITSAFLDIFFILFHSFIYLLCQVLFTYCDHLIYILIFFLNANTQISNSMESCLSKLL